MSSQEDMKGLWLTDKGYFIYITHWFDSRWIGSFISQAGKPGISYSFDQNGKAFEKSVGDLK